MKLSQRMLDTVAAMAPEAFARRMLEEGRVRAGLTRHRLRLDDGLEYVYLEGGRGEPLLLLHGFGSSKDNFARVAAHLTSHYRLLIPDHIGFGESSKPAEGDYSPPAQAERLRRFARALGIERLHLGGSSMGGHIAMTYAALYPEAVASLWLLDPGGVRSAPRQPVWESFKRTGRNPLLVDSGEDYARLFALLMSDPPYVPRPVFEVMARARIANREVEQRAFEHFGRDPLEARVEGLPVPTLIVWGEEDRVLSVACGERLQQLIPGARLIRLPGIGHLPMIECAERCAADYRAFRAELAG